MKTLEKNTHDSLTYKVKRNIQDNPEYFTNQYKNAHTLSVHRAIQSKVEWGDLRGVVRLSGFRRINGIMSQHLKEFCSPSTSDNGPRLLEAD
ncbi:hypothetical protein EVAR_76044_1 [Eumeta japonica]|uniref:Uncharacterized protein n=1 Tax=Eumeta variegata TaxID=151549 RepID=A0A4C1UAJ1_EUMVA|nr:hypothetical protein EVAR_76044_1 [Eumeta japonica]